MKSFSVNIDCDNSEQLEDALREVLSCIPATRADIDDLPMDGEVHYNAPRGVAAVFLFRHD